MTRLVQGLVTAGVFVIVIPFFIYLAVRPKKEKKKESKALWEGFKSNPDIPTRDDFINYLKHCAKEVELPEANLLTYLVQNRVLLLSTYQKISNRHVDYDKDMDYIVAKIETGY